MVPDFGDERRNRLLEEAIADLVQKIAAISGLPD
jgi:hypothetical protein